MPAPLRREEKSSRAALHTSQPRHTRATRSAHVAGAAEQQAEPHAPGVTAARVLPAGDTHQPPTDTAPTANIPQPQDAVTDNSPQPLDATADNSPQPLDVVANNAPDTAVHESEQPPVHSDSATNIPSTDEAA